MLQWLTKPFTFPKATQRLGVLELNIPHLRQTVFWLTYYIELRQDHHIRGLGRVCAEVNNNMIELFWSDTGYHKAYHAAPIVAQHQTAMLVWWDNLDTNQLYSKYAPIIWRYRTVEVGQGFVSGGSKVSILASAVQPISDAESE